MAREIFDPHKQKVPIRVWAPSESLESPALAQLQNTASLPFVFKHVAAMPDVHFGRGATVGSVIATRGAGIPAAVGVDIGCGMMALKTDIPAAQAQEQVKKIRHSIERSIPVGHECNREVAKAAAKWSGWKKWKNLH